MTDRDTRAADVIARLEAVMAELRGNVTALNAILVHPGTPGEGVST